MPRRPDTEARLRHLRGGTPPALSSGGTPPQRHNARTIAALTGNPGCARRAVVDSAGVDKELLARHAGFATPFGQSPFAITRGNVFEAQVKADGCAELLRLLGDLLGPDLGAVGYTDLNSVDGREDAALRHAHSRTALADAAAEHDGGGTLLDHPLLRLDVAGQEVYLEPDLVAFRHAGVFHIIEIKSFPVIDGVADGAKVGAAAIQAAVYVLALRRTLDRPSAVSHNVVLVCPRDFSNAPVAALVDVRRQLAVLEHQLARLARVDALLDALPPDLTLDLAVDATGAPTRPAAELVAALRQVPARYAPDCLAACDLSYLCRDEARGTTAALGASVREELGGVATVAEALGLAHGTLAPAADQADAAALLRTAARVYAEARGVAG
ncbi:MAG TPA: hypothetical protein VES42_24910 [Pilimelia sp.]|nr:hypothetical protein [Pilimelia sp.]